MEYTKNYKLPQWVETDRILMEDFNQAMVDIDAGLKSKAETEALSTLAESVNGNLATVAANLGSGGETARIAWGSYTGTGAYGDSNPTVLNFDFKPLVIFIAQAEESHSSQIGIITMIRGMPMSIYSANFYATPTWLDNGVSMFSWSSADNQMNAAQKYYYVAIGQDLNA